MNEGKNIKSIRKSLKLSQTDLAKKSGLSLRTIQRIENEETNPKFHTLHDIADALGIDISFLTASDGIEQLQEIVSNAASDDYEALTDLLESTAALQAEHGVSQQLNQMLTDYYSMTDTGQKCAAEMVNLLSKQDCFNVSKIKAAEFMKIKKESE